MSKIISASSKAIKKLNTPQLLQGGLYLTWATSLLVLVSTISGIQGQRHAINTIGKDATPSITTAQRLKDAAAGMDAYIAKELLLPSGQNQDAVKGYEERYEKLTQRLVAAAESISYGDKERKPIETLQLELGNYIAKIQQARDFHERGDTNNMLVAYRSAAEIMDEKLLPATDALDKVNVDALNVTYNKEKFDSGKSLFFIVISGVALISVLVGLQIFLSQRTRRTFNPMLLAASAIAIAFLNYTTGAFLSASQNLRIAKEDAFTSMHALRQARALGYIANAAQSRYLFDSAFALNHEQAFFNTIAKIAKPPDGDTFETVAASASASGYKPNNFTGLLADQLKNITFAGEREATVKNLTTLGAYVAIDKQIRQLERSGKHTEAIALCLGSQPGQSNWAFDEFRLKANQKTFDINQAAFDKAIKQGFKDVDGFEFTTPVALSAIALLTLFGLLPRLKEYA
ncbi:MAG: hypothetical protein KME31_36480 [Tolypothrix carrinoi HA7290-LM1]|jgi:hypothetical protein|nr:hypothetical protein [Tolypothrix carrinoi HA7290-LM1]